MNITKRIDLLSKRIPAKKEQVYTYAYFDLEPRPVPKEEGDNIMNLFLHVISPGYKDKQNDDIKKNTST